MEVREFSYFHGYSTMVLYSVASWSCHVKFNLLKLGVGNFELNLVGGHCNQRESK